MDNNNTSILELIDNNDNLKSVQAAAKAKKRQIESILEFV